MGWQFLTSEVPLYAISYKRGTPVRGFLQARYPCTYGLAVSYEQGTPVQAIQVLGGAGYVTDYPAERYYPLPCQEVLPTILSRGATHYRGTWLIRNNPPLGPFSRTMPRAIWWS